MEAAHGIGPSSSVRLDTHQNDSFGCAVNITVGLGPVGDLEGHVVVDAVGSGKRRLVVRREQKSLQARTKGKKQVGEVVCLKMSRRECKLAYSLAGCCTCQRYV